MSYIEREAVIKYLEKYADGYSYIETPTESAIADIKAIPAADVVEGEAYRELLKAARKMHCWIFLNTADELKAYDECGLTDEMNALLGYGGQFTAKIDGGADDAAD